MGYRSDVSIGITKELYVKCQLLNNIPKDLAEVEQVDYGHAFYWFIEAWKWYDSYTDIQEIEAWFNWCQDEDENPTDRGSPFGAIRLGEEAGDIEEWGDPASFDLYIHQSISRP